MCCGKRCFRSGIAVAGDPVDVDALSIKPAYETPPYRRVAIHHSAPLAEVASLINKPSQNLYADLLMKMLAAALPQEDSNLDPGSAAMGIETAMGTFARAGVDTSAIRLVDGSGLSRLNLIAPEMTTALLVFHVDAPGPKSARCILRFTSRCRKKRIIETPYETRPRRQEICVARQVH